MRKYKVIFYKERWDEKLGMVQTDLKTFWVYGYSFDQADSFARTKLAEFQNQMKDTKIAYWMEAIGQRVFDMPFSK